MKKFSLFLLVFICTSVLNAQTLIESDSYGLDQYIEKCTDIPVVRKINGGTVFKITYEPEELWDNSMKGAFEYACKIWEEQLPNNLPINIHAKIGTIRGTVAGQKLLSKVSPISYYYDHQEESPSSRIKYVLLAESNTGQNVTFNDSVKNAEFFTKPDITITYNKSLLNEFSYSLYATPVDKYDFVTVALRDIAKGLGFASSFTADSSTHTFHMTSRALTCYEKVIREAIGTEDASAAYVNSTQGELNITVPYYGNLKLYAPTSWQNGISLNYFVPDSTKNISELLTYDFGKGSVIRNIVDDYDKLFESLHGWQTYNVATGYNQFVINATGSTSNVINYNGSITVNANTTLNPIAVVNGVLPDNAFDNGSSYTNSNEFDIQSYLAPYKYMYPNEQVNDMWCGRLFISLLKKDGTWDVVYRRNTSIYDLPYEINMSDLNIDSDYDKYQRTCDGYIRCRITRYTQEYDYLYNRPFYNVQTSYYVLDYLPQKVKMGFLASSNVENASVQQTAYDNEYAQDIKINIKGLEGVERIRVEQLDEGNELPISYEIPDFKKGYFTATVDKELYTQFVVYSFNKNGYAKSEEFVVEPLSPVEEFCRVRIDNDLIKLSLYERVTKQYETTYAIYSNLPNSVNKIKQGVVDTSNCLINISDLEKGCYIMDIQSGKRHQCVKFVKKN